MKLAEVHGDPHITVEPTLLGFKFRYIMPGYVIGPHQRGYKRDGEFGQLDLERDDDNPGYLWVAGAGVDPAMSRQGYGERLYRYALAYVRERGFRGISSHRPSRRPGAADSLWNKLGGRPRGDYDLLGD